MAASTQRLQQITAMYAKHDGQLHHVVALRGSAQHATVDDACAFAWAQLLSADHVDLRPPRWGALAWLTTVAVHEAWRLDRLDARAGAFDPDTVDEISIGRSRAVAPAATVAAQHMRLQLVAQIPERPRRFLLRLALGYSYDEIAAAEGVSYTTTNKQIARAKRLLRELDAPQPWGANPRPPAPSKGVDTITLTYRGQTVALAAPARFWLAAHIEALAPGHPDKRHVCLMALYARDVLTGDMPGPYRDDDADRFARLATAGGYERGRSWRRRRRYRPRS
jgi:DNA-directed RNA polymerase specialized sigma24 family protein